MRARWLVYSVLVLAGLCLLTILVYNLPPVHSRLAWRVDALQRRYQVPLQPSG